MNLSIIIPAYNHLDKILRCLNSLQTEAAAAWTQHQWIIQDDASPEYDLRALIPRYAAMTYRNPANLGFPSNCDAAVSSALGDIVLLVNQDVFAVPDWSHHWDKALLAAFEDETVGVVGARLLFPNGSIQSAGGLFDARSQPFHRCIGYGDPHYWEVSEAREVDWVTGGALATRRDLWNKLGGFDVAYGRGYWEDVDYCMKVREAGYKVWYEPRCTFIHEVGSTGGNPQFADNARLFRQRWVDTGKVKPTDYAVRERFW